MTKSDGGDPRSGRGAGPGGDPRNPRGRRLMLVHAHPDDESIGTGATMAKYAAEGAQVTLVTCTLGELGEIIPPGLRHLAWDADGGLGQYRIGELAAACAALGVTDHRFLGHPGKWHDSGMMGTPSNDWDGAFWRADVDEAARDLLTVINEVRPQVIVTYDDNGFYGHPDHIQAHRVARRAFELADGLVSKFYATAMPKSVLAAAMALPQEDGTEVGELGGADFSRVESVDDLPFGTDDENVTTEIDAQDYLDAKLAAMRAHASQIAVDSPFFALSDMVGRRALGTEYYTLLAAPGGASPQEPSAGEGASPSPAGRENDLFAGLDG
jgi:N-acetyl-1-D-myo-inositol-2-amino-2-deoxy-alpha-D-glucopyranoside deacetylase